LSLAGMLALALVTAAYYLDPETQGWSRWLADRPDISTLTGPDHMQGVLALASFNPTPTATAIPSPVCLETAAWQLRPTPSLDTKNAEAIRWAM
jgi:hypothetical protein